MNRHEPPAVVVDASIGVKWFATEGEQNVGDARWLLELNARHQIRLAAPALLRLELMSALVKKRMPIPNVLAATRDLQRANLEWHEIDEALSFDAVSLAATHGLSVYDATYLALAEHLDCGLVTADKELAAAAGNRLVHVVNLPADPPREMWAAP